jgi:hypothetical protein
MQSFITKQPKLHTGNAYLRGDVLQLLLTSRLVSDKMLSNKREEKDQ